MMMMMMILFQLGFLVVLLYVMWRKCVRQLNRYLSAKTDEILSLFLSEWELQFPVQWMSCAACFWTRAEFVAVLYISVWLQLCGRNDKVDRERWDCGPSCSGRNVAERLHDIGRHTWLGMRGSPSRWDSVWQRKHNSYCWPLPLYAARLRQHGRWCRSGSYISMQWFVYGNTDRCMKITKIRQLLLPPPVSVAGISTSSIHTYVRTSVCVCDTFTIYTITQKILERSAPIFFVHTLETLGQHEFAFVFCGSARNLAVGICAVWTLLLYFAL